MTFDNWHGLGWCEDALVFYSADGSQIRKFGLAAFLPGFYVEALPRTISSIHWRGEQPIDEAKGQLVLPVVVPTAAGQECHQSDAHHADVLFLLSAGTFVPAAAAAWAEGVRAAKRAAAKNRTV